MKRSTTTALATVLFTMSSASAGEIPSVLEELTLGGQAVTPSSVEPAPMNGWYEVRLRTGETLYTDANARYVLAGQLFENRNDQVVNLTAQQRREQRLAQLDELDDSAYITYSAEGEEKSAITVFTDITCPYCQQLHQDISELNAAGITVRYLPFPRRGVSSPSGQRMASIWCSKYPRHALNQAFNGQTAPVGDEAKVCQPTLEQVYSLAQQFGVRGTPATVLPNGELGEGYRPVDQLVQAVSRATGNH
ncbi:DsbC family protein [Halomonas elongata]|uniref:Thiol:disulfide interchange protein n=1 Tax=Halomonas elongata (strain ATCC 33173 / DSM 2581 / NBRC 15536 / NCIMB 2198 / 1H9) TaxID=768066 RepID=E1VA60_HALED|nr:DsbC family protein [Halomonas elongata]WBF17690.1 DsbC family protein [Halomonas elongata]WPU46531.1 DsbC family protein [Halomonas elongata DSM 2581]CBV43948.1 DsbC family protein [Halomonas elongata DSM 2581]